MFLFTSAAAFNGGDVLFQLIMFIVLLAIPLTAIVLILVLRNRNRNRNDRLKRVEEKLDKLLSEKETKL